jgi:hypothetical protein
MSRTVSVSVHVALTTCALFGLLNKAAARPPGGGFRMTTPMMSMQSPMGMMPATHMSMSTMMPMTAMQHSVMMPAMAASRPIATPMTTLAVPTRLGTTTTLGATTTNLGAATTSLQGASTANLHGVSTASLQGANTTSLGSTTITTSGATTAPTTTTSVSGVPTTTTTSTLGISGITGLNGLTAFGSLYAGSLGLGGLGSSLGAGGYGGGGGSGGGGYGGGGGGYGGGNGYGAGSGQNAVVTYIPASADVANNDAGNENRKAESSEPRARQVDRSPPNILGAGREGRSTWEIELAHSLDHPPLVEIHSGRALNTLLKDLTGASPAALLSIPAKTLSLDLLGHINLRPIDIGEGNPALLKLADRLSWPPALLGNEYATGRHKLSSLLGQGIQQARSGLVDPHAVIDLQSALDAMRTRLSAHAMNVSAGDYVQAVRFLYDLSDAARALDYPQVDRLADPHLFSQAMTVNELAAYMGAKRLAFAPAVPGDEAAYDRIYEALVDCHTGAHQVALNH